MAEQQRQRRLRPNRKWRVYLPPEDEDKDEDAAPLSLPVCQALSPTRLSGRISNLSSHTSGPAHIIPIPAVRYTVGPGPQLSTRHCGICRVHFTTLRPLRGAPESRTMESCQYDVTTGPDQVGDRMRTGLTLCLPPSAGRTPQVQRQHILVTLFHHNSCLRG